MSNVLPLPPRPPFPSTRLLQFLPRFIAATNHAVPFIFQRQCVLLAMQHVLKDAIADGDLGFLSGRHLRVCISDAGINWTIGFRHQHLTLSASGLADATIRGRLADFILLMGRKEDPDTLFFQRRLVLEGDTELGLEAKNVLDTLDMDAMPGPVKPVLDWLAGQYQ